MDKNLIKTWKKLFESSINEGWSGKEGDKAYREMSEAFSQMDQQKILDMLWSWLSVEQLEKIYEWMIEEEYIYHSDEYDDEEEEDDEFNESSKEPLKEDIEKFHLKIYGKASDFEKYTSAQTKDFWQQVHSSDLDDKLDEYFETRFPTGIDVMKFNEFIRTNGNDILEELKIEEVSD